MLAGIHKPSNNQSVHISRLYEYYVTYFQLPELHFIYVMFWESALLPSYGDWLLLYWHLLLLLYINVSVGITVF